MSTDLVFFVNGKKVTEPHPDPEMTLIVYLRNTLGLRGIKLGCAEGGCGACTVMVSHFEPAAQRVVHRSVNACLAPLCSVAGMAVTTVEGIGSTKTRLHPVQERLAKSHGSQCGFCTPGIVMSMYTLLRNNPDPTLEEIEDSFDGNLCRCTGYRPILVGLKTFARDAAAGGDGGCCGGKTGGGACCKSAPSPDHDDTRTLCSTVGPFAPHDATQEVIFPPELLLQANAAFSAVQFEGPRAAWYRPDSLAHVLALKARFPHARIVGGNTELGIESKFRGSIFPVMIASTAVPEFYLLQQVEGGLHIGAGVTINNLRRFLLEKLPLLAPEHAGNYHALLENIRWFAGDQIRNVAAVGGNLVTASPISDLNPIFMASASVLTVASEARGSRTIAVTEFFLAYRKTALQPDEVLVSIFVPDTRANEFVQAYKQARRRDDDIAIVNACFRVRLAPKEEGGPPVVAESSFSFGGLAPVTAPAPLAMAAALDLPWDGTAVDAVTAALAKDFALASSTPGGMTQYRQTLAMSLFMKFFLSVQEQLAGTPSPHALAINPRHRPVSQSTQLFQAGAAASTTEAAGAAGAPIGHVAAALQTTGEAQYTDDIPPYHNELYGAPVFSQRAHAKLLKVDATAALACPGVRAFFSAQDVPGCNYIGAIAQDEHVFASGTVVCVGAVIGMIVADTQTHAQEAVRKVLIEYEDLPAIITIPQAIAAKSFYSRQTITKGSLDAGFAASDHVVEGEMHMGGQEHFYLETQATIAVPKEGGEMELLASTQNPSKTQMTVAKVLGVPANRVVCRTKRMGGGFGGKETRSVYLSCAVAVAANKLGRPVRCMLDRDEDMISSGGRHPFYAKYKVGFTNEGVIQALEIDMYSNAGCSLDLSASVMDRALFHMDNCYRIPNIRGTGYTCKTNLPTNTAFRGFGGPQGLMFAENWISDIGRVCNIPQHIVRERNFYLEGELTHFNQPLEQNQIRPVWDEVKVRSNYEARRADVDKFNAEHEFTKRGLAIIPTKFGIAFTASFLNQAGALVLVYTDGSVLLTHGGTEMGQGLHTKMIQVCAQSLGVPVDAIHVLETGTQTVPNASPTAASASSDLNGMAIVDACTQINARLAPFKAKDPSAGWKAWVNSAYFAQVSLAASGYYKTPDLGYSFESNSGRAFNYFNYGAACAEVEVDLLTGDSQIRHTTIVMDVGRSLNPAIDIGQIEGAFVQGYGLTCMEEVVCSPTGVMFSRGPGMYKLPGFKDIPLDFTVSLLRNAPNERAVMSSKAVGEPPLFLGASVFFAIKDAIVAARAQAGVPSTQVFRLDSPASVERTRMACPDRFSSQFPPHPADAKTWNVVL